MFNTKPSVHYYFTYISLPDLIRSHYDDFIGLVEAGEETLQKVFVNLWNKIAEEMESDDIFDEKEKSFFFELITDKNYPLMVLIDLPMPKNIPEAVCLLIVMSEHSPRFFTAELTYQEENNLGFVVGETTITGHSNYGKVKTPDEFISRVKEIVK